MTDATRKDPSTFPYATHLSVRFAPLTRIDLDPLVAR
jgi:hypothetical protein